MQQNNKSIVCMNLLMKDSPVYMHKSNVKRAAFGPADLRSVHTLITVGNVQKEILLMMFLKCNKEVYFKFIITF